MTMIKIKKIVLHQINVHQSYLLGCTILACIVTVSVICKVYESTAPVGQAEVDIYTLSR